MSRRKQIKKRASNKKPEKSTKIKEIPLKMKWNPGVHKYEPDLPVKKTSKKEKVKIEIDWPFIIALIIAALIGIFIVIRKFLF